MVRIQLYPDRPDTDRLKIKLNFNVMPKQKSPAVGSTDGITISAEKKVNFEFKYKWKTDYSLAVYPLWIMINNRILNGNSRYEMLKVYNNDGFRGFYRGLGPYMLLSLIVNGHFEINREGERWNDPSKTKRHILVYLANACLISWRINTSIELYRKKPAFIETIK